MVKETKNLLNVDIDYFEYGNFILNNKSLDILYKKKAIKDLYNKINFSLEYNLASSTEYDLKVKNAFVELTKSLMDNSIVKYDELKDFIPKNIDKLRNIDDIFERYLSIPNIGSLDVRKFKELKKEFPNFTTIYNKNTFEKYISLISSSRSLEIVRDFYNRDDVKNDIIFELLKGNHESQYDNIICDVYKNKDSDEYQKFFEELLKNKINKENILEDASGDNFLYISLEQLIIMNSSLLSDYSLNIGCEYFYDICIDLLKETIEHGNFSNLISMENYLLKVLNNDNLIVNSDDSQIKKYFNSDKINNLYKNAIECKDYKMIDYFEKKIFHNDKISDDKELTYKKSKRKNF